MPLNDYVKKLADEFNVLEEDCVWQAMKVMLDDLEKKQNFIMKFPPANNQNNSLKRLYDENQKNTEVDEPKQVPELPLE